MRVQKLILPALFLLMSCKSTSSNWFVSPDQNPFGWSDVTFCVPAQKVINKYLDELHNVDFIKIDLNIAIEYCGDSFDGELKPYVLRALQINKFTGKYYVKKKGDRIWVNHNSLASEEAEMSESAIIVFLNEIPKLFFVTAYADGQTWYMGSAISSSPSIGNSKYLQLFTGSVDTENKIAKELNPNSPVRHRTKGHGGDKYN